MEVYKRNSLWLVLSVVIFLLDIWTKNLASSQLQYARPVEILPILNFTLLHNPGAAFSFLSDAGGWQRWFFTVISAVVSAVLLVWLFRLQRNEKLLALSLALILGGAIGNLYDRVTLGYVVDFISFHYAGRYFPAFNIADSAISVGAVLMILDMFFGSQARSADAEVND
ncbi:MAG: signal peptidase II [Pseudomonadales bacterium]